MIDRAMLVAWRKGMIEVSQEEAGETIDKLLAVKEAAEKTLYDKQNSTVTQWEYLQKALAACSDPEGAKCGVCGQLISDSFTFRSHQMVCGNPERKGG